MSDFLQETRDRIQQQGQSESLKKLANDFMVATTEPKYCYNFTWLGRPVIQYPQDIVAMQELLFSVQPDVVVETGIAHGGSLILYASILELVAACGGPSDARVIGVDIEIRDHNRQAIEAHPMFKRITMFQGSSTDAAIVDTVKAEIRPDQKVMVVLDSNHTHDHVLKELELYAPLTSVGSYCVVFDTIIEDMPEGMYPDRPWDVGDNPKTAANTYVEQHSEFVVDLEKDAQLLITVAPGGFLKRVR